MNSSQRSTRRIQIGNTRLGGLQEFDHEVIGTTKGYAPKNSDRNPQDFNAEAHGDSTLHSFGPQMRKTKTYTEDHLKGPQEVNPELDKIDTPRGMRQTEENDERNTMQARYSSL